jgi:hypothetical protein
MGKGGAPGTADKKGVGHGGRPGSRGERRKWIPKVRVAQRYLATFLSIAKWKSLEAEENLLKVMTAYPMSGRQVT